jgi:hypothetical protein
MAPFAIAALAAPQRSDLRRNQPLEKEKEKVVRREIRPPSLPAQFLRSSSLSLFLSMSGENRYLV